MRGNLSLRTKCKIYIFFALEVIKIAKIFLFILDVYLKKILINKYRDGLTLKGKLYRKQQFLSLVKILLSISIQLFYVYTISHE